MKAIEYKVYGGTEVLQLNEVTKPTPNPKKNGSRYDFIFDTVGKRSFSQCKNSLSHSGIYLSAIIGFPPILQVIGTSFYGSKKAKTSSTGMLPIRKRLSYFLEIQALLATGDIKTVIDMPFPLSEMKAAHQYVEKGHKKGNIIITL